MDGLADVMVGIIIGVVTAAVATAITFYVKDYLRERARFRKFEEKLKNIAGKNAIVIIPNIGQVRITDISRQGLTVQGELCTTFIPMEKVLQTEVSLPVENYERLLKDTMRRNVEQTLDVVFPPFMEKLKEVFVREFLKDDSELSAIVAFKVKGELKEQGVQVRELSGKKEVTFRQIAERIEKEKPKKT